MKRCWKKKQWQKIIIAAWEREHKIENEYKPIWIRQKRSIKNAVKFNEQKGDSRSISVSMRAFYSRFWLVLCLPKLYFLCIFFCVCMHAWKIWWMCVFEIPLSLSSTAQCTHTLTNIDHLTHILNDLKWVHSLVWAPLNRSFNFHSCVMLFLVQNSTEECVQFVSVYGGIRTEWRLTLHIPPILQTDTY